MKRTPEMIEAFVKKALLEAPEDKKPIDIEAGIQAVLDLVDPIHDTLDKVYDAQGRCWRRNSYCRDVWHTSSFSRVATSRYLVDVYGPITFRATPIGEIRG